ncbi:hypothetical protein DesLBE_3117 [Desulfitobacterium sp. LBE]|uniref:Uncharacterized protein n=1 Tax=Desulfitobacterium hafniense TaxID=49338 RepID=A0A098AUT4_DESHA|nr:hypothetical protein DesLBE_3117 [Desulfitobacterium sp. LBE]CDX00273.1 Hypothetical protein DPCES_0386 [Desulfitobacterium hafniense]
MDAEKGRVDIVVYENSERAVGNAELHRFNRLCEILETQEIFIKRYSFTKDKEQCRKNKDLWRCEC